MKTTATNKKQLATVTTAAKNDLKKISIMYYVNQLNKLAKKNEFVENTNIRDLGVMLKKHTGEKDLFTARCFEKDYQGRACVVSEYKGEVSAIELQHGDIVTDKGRELRLSSSSDSVVIYKPVALSLPGLVSAYKSILAPVAAAADKAAREQEKENRKTANKTAAAARKAVREQQKQAVIDYNSGKIDISEFAAIMAKAC